MKVCEITGKAVMVGNNVSHSHHKTKRTFSPNLKTKRFWSEEEGRWITLKVTAAGMKTINKKVWLLHYVRQLLLRKFTKEE